MTGNNSAYQFSPHPEAKAMNWDDLVLPVQHAVRELLVLVAGAKRISDEKKNDERDQDSDNKDTANCFLLHGARGAGKTTVILSARKAICNKDVFFSENARKESGKSEAHSAYKCVTNDKLEHVTWLELLDMEPLPADANLLATVLTRIRNALETREGVSKNSALTSIFEEDEESARQLLSSLIGDATMMWETVKEDDTRETVNRQITTAGIYASFRTRFIKAIDKLSEELGRPYGRDIRIPIILPLDNIDRSTEHLKSIVKLAELVSHPRLWLIMAGGREEISNYLERAYWKELISTHVGVGPLGRTDPKGEDETLAMARRQAAASTLKLWPSNHRIKLKPVEPKDALDFRPKNEKDTLSDLFRKISIPTWLDESAGPTPNNHTKKENHLIDFFVFDDLDIQSFSKEDGKKKCPISLTRAGQLALRLPARSLLDLWQLTYWVYNDSVTFPPGYRKAEKIARTMLRNTLSESKVQNKISKILHEYVIRYEAGQGTLLNFNELEFKVDCITPYDTASYLYSEPRKGDKDNPIKSFIGVRSSQDSFLIFKLKDAQNSHRDERCYNEELPTKVAGWLLILYDILALSDKLAVINRAIIDPPVITTTHGLLVTREVDRKHYVEQHLKWPIPEWITFRAYDIFRQCWRKFQKDYESMSKTLGEQKKIPENHHKNIELQSRYLAAGWISCALYTFEALTFQEIKFISNDEPLSKDSIKKFEETVMKRASELYSELYAEVSKPYIYFDQDIMLHWLENKLPLLLSYWYVPTSDRISDKPQKENKHSRFADILELLKEDKLAEYWKNNTAFIVAAMDDNLENLFQEETADKTDNEYFRTKIDKEYQAYLKVLRELCALHKWSTDASGTETSSDAS